MRYKSLFVSFTLLLFNFVSTNEDRLRRASAKRLPTQEEADCPRGCRCDRTSVTCLNRDFKDANKIFGQLHPLAFPHLDSIVVTGNRFGDLSFPLFDDEEIHEKVTMLNLSFNGITKIGKDTFRATPNVEYLYLEGNRIESVDSRPFEGLQRLRVLHLGQALAPDRSASSKSDLLSLLFDSRTRGFNNLQEIDLSGNGLESIHPETFCKVNGLARLILRDNRLKTFDGSSKCLEQLKQLVLSGNKFTTVPAKMIELMPSLNAFDISRNPLTCDCELMPFVKLTRENPNDYTMQGETTCAAPSNFRDQLVFEIKGDLCEGGGGRVLPHLLLLIVIGVAVFFVYRRFRDRIPIPPAFQFGYQNLNEAAQREERAKPEFV